MFKTWVCMALALRSPKRLVLEHGATPAMGPQRLPCRKWPLVLIVCCAVATVTAQSPPVPQLVNYQGKLTDQNGDPLATAEYSLSFSIYDADGSVGNEGTRVWAQKSTTMSRWSRDTSTSCSDRLTMLRRLGPSLMHSTNRADSCKSRSSGRAPAAPMKLSRLGKES